MNRCFGNNIFGLGTTLEIETRAHVRCCGKQTDLPGAINLKYACIWGSAKFEGQRVQRDYVLHDRDVVEFHVK